ncbi:hypothetical protein GCM10010306_083140 [Streptomyces umbrinus]|nr:hypothetical protein GCM10010306_083140 [Streptomyces umbrinus]
MLKPYRTGQLARSYRRRIAEAVSGGQSQAVAQVPGRLFVDAVGHAEGETAGHPVAGAAQRTGAREDRGWEVAGRCGGLEVDAEARYARGLGEMPAEWGRGGREQEQVRFAVGHGIGEPLAQFGDERDGGAHQFTAAPDAAVGPGVGGEAAEFQARLAYERSKGVCGGQGYLVPGTAQFGAQARVGRDVATRSGRGDHDSHRSSRPSWESVRESVRESAQLDALAWTASHR